MGTAAVRRAAPANRTAPMGSSSAAAFRPCWPASTSVGAMMAAWWPDSTASRHAARATTVLPDPTSPWSRRFMGCGRAMAAETSSMARRCPAVSSNGSEATKVPISSPSVRWTTPTSCAATRCLRNPTPSSRTNSSSNFSRSWARARSSCVSGKWIRRMAQSKVGRRSARTISAGSGSGTGSSRSRAKNTSSRTVRGAIPSDARCMGMIRRVWMARSSSRRLSTSPPFSCRWPPRSSTSPHAATSSPWRNWLAFHGWLKNGICR